VNGDGKPVLVLLVAALALILSACSGDGAGDGGGGEKDGKEPGASSHDVGQRVTTGAGNKVTVHAYEQPYRDREEQLDPGTEFASIDVEACAGSEDAATDPRQWQLLMPDNRRPEPELYALPIREPQFPAAPLPAGECVRGWITFQVPTGVRAEEVVNVAADRRISWSASSDQ
jgi:hypothetical protein